MREVPLQGKGQTRIQRRHEAAPGRDGEHVDRAIPKLLGDVLHGHEQVGVKYVGHLHYHRHGICVPHGAAQEGSQLGAVERGDRRRFLAVDAGGDQHPACSRRRGGGAWHCEALWWWVWWGGWS